MIRLYDKRVSEMLQQSTKGEIMTKDTSIIAMVAAYQQATYALYLHSRVHIQEVAIWQDGGEVIGHVLTSEGDNMLPEIVFYDTTVAALIGTHIARNTVAVGSKEHTYTSSIIQSLYHSLERTFDNATAYYRSLGLPDDHGEDTRLANVVYHVRDTLETVSSVNVITLVASVIMIRWYAHKYDQRQVAGLSGKEYDDIIKDPLAAIDIVMRLNNNQR